MTTLERLNKMISAKTKAIKEKRSECDDLEKKAEEITDPNEVDKLQELKDKIAALNAELDSLNAELTELTTTATEMDEPAVPADQETKGERKLNIKEAMRMANGVEMEKSEERAKKFVESGKMVIDNKEARSILVSSGTLATPTEVSGINGMFNQVSSIVDLVKVVNCQGMGSNKVAYQATVGTAAEQTEGNSYNESDPTFNFVTITPDTESIISYISKQTKKQTPLDYEGKVRDSALTALRQKAAAKITTKVLASSINTTLSVASATIDDKTLRKIALNYGGNENVVGNAVLFLNKADLIAFGDVRGTNGNKSAVYEITPDTSNPNTGIIKDGGLSVKYCINSNCTALTGSTQGTSAIKTMFYGQPENFELDLFSDYDIAVSDDFKFDKGLLAIRGDVELGGDVVAKDGFVVVTLPATGD